MERLQKVIANSGYTSRRKAENLIKDGHVKVNGIVANTLGYKVNANDTISIDDIILPKENKKVYYLLNKPRGYVSTTSDEHGRKTITSLIDTEERIYPVGRLDYDTTGAIILTNDGELANILMHPKNEVPKLYVAKIRGILYPNYIKQLEEGITIDNVKTSNSVVKVKKYDKLTNTSIVEITIHEGKNHQIKKMFEAIGYKVLKLKREKIAFLSVDKLKSGEYRKLTIKEVKKLYSLK